MAINCVRWKREIKQSYEQGLLVSNVSHGKKPYATKGGAYLGKLSVPWRKYSIQTRAISECKV